MSQPATPRQRMLVEHLQARGVTSPRVLRAMARVPREEFVPAFLRCQAYDDRPLQIGYEQTISQPYVVGLMTDALQLRGGERVLEIGTGSGYQAAVLAAAGAKVYSIERLSKLALRAQQTLERLGVEGVYCRVGNGALGWPEAAPFDAIIVTAGATSLPPAFMGQLVEGGRLVIPIGPAGDQILHRYLKRGDDWMDEPLTRVAFVPFAQERPA